MKQNLLKSKQIPLEFQVEPKKFKKYHKIKYKAQELSLSGKRGGSTILNPLQYNFSVRQLLAILKLLKPALKETNRTGRVFLPISVDTIITKKPKDIRMGRGKGVPSEKIFVSRPGQLFYSIYGLSQLNAHLLNKAVLAKLKNFKIINSYKW